MSAGRSDSVGNCISDLVSFKILLTNDECPERFLLTDYYFFSIDAKLYITSVGSYKTLGFWVE